MATTDTQHQLLATCWTTAGNIGPMHVDQRSPFGLEDRIRLAAEAGYTGMGILHCDLIEARKRLGGYNRVHELLADSGITNVEVEWITDWWYPAGPTREASDAIRAELLQAAETLGADHIKVGGELNGNAVDWDNFVTEFAALCEQAAEHGTKIAFEPMPMDNVVNLSRARELIDQANRPAGGLMIDIWHMSRGTVTNYDEIAALPARYITAVELGDADSQVVGTLTEDMWYNRRLCGEGNQDVTGFIRAVAATGYSGPWGIEMIAEDFRKLDLHSQVTRSYDTTLAALRNAGV